MKKKWKQITKGTGLFAGAILFSGLFFCVPTHAEDISIQETFPDDTFRSYILENFDSNGDGLLSTDEINVVTHIGVSEYGINSLDGIEVFSNLQNLDCSFNNLSELDISNNQKLTNLYCSDNNIVELNVSNNKELAYLSCGYNQILDLDVSSNLNLEFLSCDCNRLTDIDISKNKNLSDLNVEGNSLKELDVTQNSNLNYLNCGENYLTFLDVSNNTMLESLNCDYNQLDELDVSQNSQLETLYCSNNQLTSLDISNTVLDVYGLGCFNNVKRMILYNNQLDIAALPGKFDTSKVHTMTGGTLKNNMITFNSEQVEYGYIVGNSVYVTFTLVADNYDPNIVPDDSDIEDPADTGNSSDTNTTGGSGSNQSQQQSAVTTPSTPSPSNTNKEAIISGGTVTDNKTKATYKISGNAATGYTATYMKPNSKKVKTVTIPSTITVNGVSCKVTSITANAFKGQKKLKKVTIGTNVTTIGKKAFFKCSSLKKITVKSKVLKKVGAKAFSKINSSAKIKVPKNKKKAYKKVFKKNTGITLAK